MMTNEDTKNSKSEEDKGGVPPTIPNSEDCLDYVPANGVNEDGSTEVKVERDGIKPVPTEHTKNKSAKLDRAKSEKSQ